jgi:phage shock protein A
LEETQKKLGSIGFKLPYNLQECQRALTHHERSFKAMIRLEEQTKKLRQKHQDELAAEHKPRGTRKQRESSGGYKEQSRQRSYTRNADKHEDSITKVGFPIC